LHGYFSYKINPPYGSGLFVAVTSQYPLFENHHREHVEAVHKYLPALETALRTATQGSLTKGVMTTYQYIEIVE
jgi:hypothetical protein